MAIHHTNDLMKTALHAQYDASGTLELADLLELYKADFPDYFGMGQKSFLQSALDDLSVTYSPTAHLADLAKLYWANVTFSGATPNGLALNTSGDALEINTSGDLLLRN